VLVGSRHGLVEGGRGAAENGGAGRLAVRRRDLIALLGGTILVQAPEVRGQEAGKDLSHRYLV